MKYIGTFRDKYNQTFQVIIVTNNDASEETELTFTFESPVIITQSSSDGIFSPIKSRGCTVVLESKDEYWDIFSAESHGTSLVVNNLSKPECVFQGWVTPCQYNQPYNYLNEIEIEAVDCISTLQDFDFEYVRGKQSYQTIRDVIIACINKAGYDNGKIYMPYDGCMSKTIHDARSASNKYYPTQYEYINDDNFFDTNEEHSPMKCFEVLEHIATFYNMSIVPYGNDVYFIDYAIINNSTTAEWVEMRSGEYVVLPLPSNITIDDYAGDDQNVEIDEVYNKIIIKADVNEIGEDEIIQDPFDDKYDEPEFLSFFEDGVVCSNGDEWTIPCRWFYYPHGGYGGDYNSDSNWWHAFNSNAEQGYLGSMTYGSNFVNTEYWYPDDWSFLEPTVGLLGHPFTTQGCVMQQMFGFEKTKKVPTKAAWDDYLAFFPQGYRMSKYINSQNKTTTATRDYWYGTIYENHMGGTKPVIGYTSNEYLHYSSPLGDITNYIIFKGDLFYQRNHKDGDYRNFIWSNTHIGTASMGMWTYGEAYNKEDDAEKRSSGDALYNDGWKMLKAKMSIGDSNQRKWWSGYSWVSYETTFWVSYHKEHAVDGKEEKLVWQGWNVPVTNFTYKDMIDEDNAIAIPIKSSDSLHGYLTFEMYMPKIPWDNHDYGAGTKDLGRKTLYNDAYGYLRMEYRKTPPIIWMKNFGLTLKSVNTEKPFLHVVEKGGDEDIIYTKSINSKNIIDMDELELKINCFNEKKPIAKSYITVPTYVGGNSTKLEQKFFDPSSNSEARQEEILLGRYYWHYNRPKTIYNCVVHGYKMPYEKISATALPDKSFIVDEQNWNIKQDINEVKLIEVIDTLEEIYEVDRTVPQYTYSEIAGQLTTEFDAAVFNEEDRVAYAYKDLFGVSNAYMEHKVPVKMKVVVNEPYVIEDVVTRTVNGSISVDIPEPEEPEAQSEDGVQSRAATANASHDLEVEVPTLSLVDNYVEKESETEIAYTTSYAYMYAYQESYSYSYAYQWYSYEPQAYFSSGSTAKMLDLPTSRSIAWSPYDVYK